MKYANFDHTAAVRRKVSRILKLYESRFVLLICQEIGLHFSYIATGLVNLGYL